MHPLLPSDPPANGNFVELVLRHCRQHPWVTALMIPRHRDERGLTELDELSFGDLGRLIQQARAALRAWGLRVQDRVVVLDRPGAALYASVLALLAEGMVPVFIDTGMKPRAMLAALRAANPRLVLTMPGLVRWHRLIPGAGQYRWRPLADLFEAPVAIPPSALWDTQPIRPGMHALISYTSGTTGRPKGADRTHDSLIQQHRAIRQEWPDGTHDIDMTSLPVLVLHSLCCGMPSLLPILNFAAPGKVEAEWVLRQIERFGVTRLSGAPAFMERLARGSLELGLVPACLREISLGGAPVGRNLARLLREAFPQVHIRVVYGSTEAEPIASCGLDEVLATEGEGFLVGRLAESAEVWLCRLTGGSLPRQEADLIPRLVPIGEMGEVLVTGPHVLKSYVDDEEATRQNKIPRPQGQVWHRTGDLARRDAEGRLWLQGRAAEQVWQRGQWRPVFPLEARLLAHPAVRQAALVQARPEQRPTLYYSLQPGVVAEEAVAQELMELARQHGFQNIRLRCLKRLPVDRRHNSKIDRHKLRRRP